MMRRRCYDLIGGFDKRFHVIGDFDMSLRLAESWKVVSISEVLAHLRLHKTNETDKNKLLHINELKIWKEDAKHRKISFQDSGMKVFEKNIYYMEGLYAIIKKDTVKILIKLISLFDIKSLPLNHAVFIPSL